MFLFGGGACALLVMVHSIYQMRLTKTHSFLSKYYMIQIERDAFYSDVSDKILFSRLIIESFDNLRIEFSRLLANLS